MALQFSKETKHTSDNSPYVREDCGKNHFTVSRPLSVSNQSFSVYFLSFIISLFHSKFILKLFLKLRVCVCLQVYSLALLFWIRLDNTCEWRLRHFCSLQRLSCHRRLPKRDWWSVSYQRLPELVRGCQRLLLPHIFCFALIYLLCGWSMGYCPWCIFSFQPWIQQIPKYSNIRDKLRLLIMPRIQFCAFIFLELTESRYKCVQFHVQINLRFGYMIT